MFTSVSLKNTDTSTPSISLPISTIPSWSSALTCSSSFLVMYVNAILPFSSNSILFIAIFLNSNFSFDTVCNAFLYISDTFTPLDNSSAANSNVSGFTFWYLNPPVSVIIPVSKHVPISCVISIPIVFNTVINIWQQAGAVGFTKL